MKKILSVLLVLVMILGLASCASKKNTDITINSEEKIFKTLSDFSGADVSSVVGSAFPELADSVIPDLKHTFLNTISDQITSLNTSKNDAILLDLPVAELAISQNPNLAIFPEIVVDDKYGLIVSKEFKYTEKATEIFESLKNDGTLKQISERWISGDESGKIMPRFDYKADFDGSEGTLKFAYQEIMPMAYTGEKGQALGFDVEIAARIAYELNMKIEFISMNMDSIISAIASNKIDMSGGAVSYTDERKQKVDYIGPNYEGGIVLVVNKDRIAGYQNTPEQESNGFAEFLKGISESFVKTFVVENRWELVLSGLAVTIIISIFSVILGTILGALVCSLRCSKIKILSFIAKFYIRFIQGTPIVVMLMILYYLIFGNVDIDAIIVAIIGFSINFAAYSSEMFRTGINAIDKGQHEAAAASGFSKLQTFIHITLPQAARHVLPVYKGEFINMVKMTSVVGYIAIQDLTKVSDIIRSRTFEAFFPLIATAVIYFAITYFFIILLNLIERKIDPKRRKRIVKGVADNDKN